MLFFAEDLKDYFSKYGDVVSCTLKTEMETKRSRGFGFVVFTSSDIVEKVILNLPCNQSLTLFPGLETTNF